MDTRQILDPVQVQSQHQLLLLQLVRQAPYPPRICHTIAGLGDVVHLQRLGRHQVISSK